MSVVLVLIATGEKYWPYIQPLVESAHRLFPPHATLMFSDADQYLAKRWVPAIRYCRGLWISAPDLGYPATTLLRYHLILSQREWLASFDHIFYCDIDMLFVAPVEESEILSDGITATLHPGWIHQAGAPYEPRPASSAFVDKGEHYYCGGFVGGASAAFLEMAEEIKRQVDCDFTKGIIALWHDESHLCHYLHDHPPAKTLSPSFCYPAPERLAYYRGIWAGNDFEPKLMCLEKTA